MGLFPVPMRLWRQNLFVANNEPPPLLARVRRLVRSPDRSAVGVATYWLLQPFLDTERPR
jgi:hypothetical protein